MIGGFLKFTAVLVLIVAIVLGSLLNENTNFLKKAGLFKYLDGRVSSGKQKFLMGMTPMVHADADWGFTEAEIPDLAGQTILVTGGNVGLGYWTAFHLAKNNAQVVIGCRNQKRCDAAASKLSSETGGKVDTAVLDLSSFASIRAGAKALKKKYKALHSLVLNAGVMVPPFTLTKEGLELQIGTNHFGHFLLTDLLLPLLEAGSKTSTPTVVAVSSAAHYDSYPEGIKWTLEAMNDESAYDRRFAYGQSKLANVLFSQELAKRVKSKGILVNAIHPGAVDTELSRHIVSVLQPIMGEAGASYFKNKIVAAALWSPREAALTQVYASIGPALRKNKLSGKYFHPIARLNEHPDPHTFNSTLQKRLWDLSAEFIATH